MRESIEKFKAKKEKSVLDKLTEIKSNEIKRAKEDKSGTPWSLIDPDLLINDAKELFSHYEKGEIYIAQGELKKVSDEIGEIEQKDKKISNESFIRWIDDKIGTEIIKRELEEDREKDNY